MHTESFLKMRSGGIELLNLDNLEYMSGLPDNSFDLAIVDPPYGIGQNWSKDRKSQFYKHRNKFNNSIPGDAEKQFGSAGEIAWTSITKFPLIKVTLNWNGCVVCEPYKRIHPHQKPVKLYRWCLEKFAEEGWKILDTHLGSGSSAVAAKEMGFEFTGLEKEKMYFDAAANRVLNHKPQTSLDMLLAEQRSPVRWRRL